MTDQGDGALLAGKVAIVTGAAGGQGRAEALLLAERGCRVLATDVDEAGWEPEYDGRQSIRFVRLDVTSQSEWDGVVRQACDIFGGVDILVNNAGMFVPSEMRDTTEADFERHYRVNQLGPFLGMAAVVETMRARGGGSIVNISSVGALKGFPGEFAYCASKWALRGMSRCAAIELARYAIRVNTVLPGPIDTAMLGDERNSVSWAEHVPLGRLGVPLEVAELVAFLASPRAAYITGAEIAIDGGMVA